MYAVGGAGPASLGEMLQLELDCGDDLRVDQLSKLAFAEKLAQQVSVEGQSQRARRSASGASAS